MRLRALIPALAVGLLAPLAPLAPQATARTAPAAEPSPATWYETQKPAWKHCGGTAPARFQCATLQMPLDYRRPDGPTIGVAISRLATSTPEQRRGVLLFNPGGPGGSGLEDPLLFAKDLPRSVLERYDLIGFDPRGVGRSSPLNCGLDEDEKAGGFWSPYKPETEQRDIARSRSIAEKCRAREGERVPHISTRNTARDMDVIRAVLGERKISYIGVSYGTYLGAVYTQMFPHRADRFILDSAVDPTLAWRGMFRTWGPEAETAFTRWTRWTAARDARYDLGGTPAQVRDTFWGLVRKAERTPISLHGREWNGDAIRLLRPTFFSVKEGADAMANLRRASLGLPVGPAPATPAFPDMTGFWDTLWSIACGDDDTSWPRDPGTYREDAIRDKARYPLYGDFASSVKACAFWGTSPEPVTTFDKPAKALILQNEWDSQTSYANGLGMHRTLKGSRLVSVKGGEGHGIYNYAPNPCALKSANDYLITGVLPHQNVTCTAVDDQTSHRATPSLRPPVSRKAGML